MTLTPFEQYSVDLYLSTHVSQVSELSKIQQSHWHLGQKIYNNRKSRGK